MNACTVVPRELVRGSAFYAVGALSLWLEAGSFVRNGYSHKFGL